MLNPSMFFWLPVPFMIIGAFGVTLFGNLPGQTAVAVAFNILMALPAFWALYYQLKFRAFYAIASVSVFAYAIESCGVLTGWPYGAFSYGNELGPKLFSAVPLLLPFSYVPLVIGSLAIAKTFASHRLLQWLLGVVILVSYDLVLDPGAVKVGYWTWQSPGLYYDIPFTNYLGWFLSGSIGIAILNAFLSTPIPRQQLPLFISSFFWSAVFWTAVCIIEFMLIPSIIGALLTTFCIRLIKQESTNLVGGPSLT